jgi:hypothetical protein
MHKKLHFSQNEKKIQFLWNFLIGISLDVVSWILNVVFDHFTLTSIRNLVAKERNSLFNAVTVCVDVYGDTHTEKNSIFFNLMYYCIEIDISKRKNIILHITDLN